MRIITGILASIVISWCGGAQATEKSLTDLVPLVAPLPEKIAQDVMAAVPRPVELRPIAKDVKNSVRASAQSLALPLRPASNVRSFVLSDPVPPRSLQRGKKTIATRPVDRRDMPSLSPVKTPSNMSSAQAQALLSVFHVPEHF